MDDEHTETPAASSTGAPSGDRTERDDVAADLRTLVSIRSRATARTRPLPSLFSKLPPEVREDPEARFAALEDLVEAAIGDVADQDHQLAAQRLIGRASGRWRPLKQRGAEAASVFQVGWDAYRRRHDALGRSVLDETLDLVAGAVLGRTQGRSSAALDAAGSGPPAGPAAHAGPTAVTIEEATQEVSSPFSPTPDANRHLWLLVAVAALVAGATSAVVIARVMGTKANEPAAVDCGDLTAEAGELRPRSDPIVERWSEPFRAFASTLDPTLVACAWPIETAGSGVLQRVAASSGAGEGAIVATTATSGDSVIYLTPSELTTFTTRELDTAEPQDRLGWATGRADRADGTRVVRFESGTIISESQDGPAIAVTNRFWEAWSERGRLDGAPGRPLGVASTSNGESRRQDFEGGYIEADFSDGILAWAPYTSDAPSLDDEQRGRIVTITDGETSWFIDRAGARHWLPTASDLDCIEDAQVRPKLTDVDPRLVDSLPLEDVLRCT